MSSSDKVKLDGVAAGANKTIVDSSLNGTSTNAIQNKAVKTALDGKASSSHTHPTSQITGLDSALAGKADKSHTHDDRYYTESEANSKFSPIGGSASLNKLSENVTLGNGSAGSIVQNSGTYHQKFEILDDANAGTDTFVFSQSTDSGAKFTKLMSIRDDGNVVANKFTGALSGNAASASSVPWSGVAGKPSSFTPSSHTHDDRYILGGTWTELKGVFPYYNASTATGGSNTHKLSSGEMPAHKHDARIHITGSEAKGYGLAQNAGFKDRVVVAYGGYGYYTGDTGGTGSHNNMPKYQSLYAWRRSA